MVQPEMDEAADLALEDLLKNYSEEERAAMVRWFNQHYMAAGHKRLGRVLVKLAKDA